MICVFKCFINKYLENVVSIYNQYSVEPYFFAAGANLSLIRLLKIQSPQYDAATKRWCVQGEM